MQQVERRKVVLYVQSKDRSRAARAYPTGAPKQEAGKCWDVPGVESCLRDLKKEAGRCWDVPGLESCLIDFIDGRGRAEVGELLEVGSDTEVLTVPRDSRLISYGVAMATVKRCREVMEQNAQQKKLKR